MFDKRHRKPAPVATKKTNYIALVVDQSGSMNRVRDAAQRMVHAVMAGFANVPADQETFISYYPFSDIVHEEDAFRFVPAADAQPNTYRIRGNTALDLAVGTAIEDLEHAPRASDPNTSFMVIVVTDGEENWSHFSRLTYTRDEVRSEVEATQSSGRWTYVFHCPPKTKDTILARYRLLTDNVREWAPTEQGMREVEYTTRVGTQSYYGERTKGLRATTTFFVQPDLSKLSPAEIRRKLNDVSGHVHMYEVRDEDRIDEFVKRKTRRPYVTGQAYYQLMKTEKVQADKEVLLTELNGTQVWAGPQARALVGLPDGAEARVNPGNHAGYTIFVQSRSPNRRLPRGTKVLIDTARVKGAKPTWEAPLAPAMAGSSS